MDITKAKKVIELSRDNKKILITLWDGDKISSCIEEEQKQQCQFCQGDEALCNDYINHLKEQGYEATEVELGELEAEESLPKFLEEKEIRVKPVVVEEEEKPVKNDQEEEEPNVR